MKTLVKLVLCASTLALPVRALYASLARLTEGAGFDDVFGPAPMTP